MDRVLGGRGDAALDADGDPYITLGGEEEDSEDEGFEIKPTDLLILAARNEDDVSNLEVWVYEEADDGGEANVYVHHDILLPAFPLCVCWLDCSPGGGSDRVNMAAVGTMETGIEIWDLDVIDSVEPAATLGGEEKAAPADAGSSETGDKKKKKKVRPFILSTAFEGGYCPAWEVDSPLCLSLLFPSAEKEQEPSEGGEPRGLSAGPILVPAVQERAGLRLGRQDGQGMGHLPPGLRTHAYTPHEQGSGCRMESGGGAGAADRIFRPFSMPGELGAYAKRAAAAKGTWRGEEGGSSWS